MNLSEKTKNEILNLQKNYPERRSALIPSLHLAQKEIGYLPHHTQKEVADLFEIDTNEINALVSFYDMFSDKPTGKHHLHVCKNLSCMLRGGDQLLQELCKKLGIKPGETTADGKFTLLATECLAACDKAPLILTEKVKGPINIEEIDKILKEIQEETPHE